MTHHSVNIFFKILFKKIALNSAFWNKLYPPYCSYVFLLQITKDRCSDFNQQRPPLTEGGLPVVQLHQLKLQSAQKCQIRNNGNKWFFRYLKDPSNLWYLCYALFLYKNLLQLYEYRGWNLQTFKNTSLRINPSLKLKICKFYSCF